MRALFLQLQKFYLSLRRKWSETSRSYRYTFGATFFLLVGIGLIMCIAPVHAQADQTISQTVAQKALDAVAVPVAQMLLWVARLLQKLTLFEVDFLQVLASYNGYLKSPAVNVGWFVVRDTANMAFVIVLLVIAFATIIGSEAYEWKKLLPKMVLAAILINFSRTICGVLIDASQVVIMTFLNAVSATIGGSVIQSFAFASFEKFHTAVTADTSSSLANFATPGVFTAAVVAAGFSALVCVMMGFYVGILLARVVRLWVLIVLSPLAFIFSILPATQGYAKQWWDELMDDLVTGPVILFFIWLAFVIVGSGQVNQDLIANSALPNKDALASSFNSQTAGVTDVLGWNNLSNLIIGIGILMVGVRVSGQIGGTSGSIMSSALNFGKRVATLATGYVAGRWLYDKGVGAIGSGIGALGGAVLKPAERFIQKRKENLKTLYRLAPGVGTVARNLTAKDLESAASEKNASGEYTHSLAGRLGRRVLASLWESGGRKDKVVADYEAATEKAVEIEERTYGTSKLGVGQDKQSYTETARLLEAVDSAKKVEKSSGEQVEQEKVARELLGLEQAVEQASTPEEKEAAQNAFNAKEGALNARQRLYYNNFKEVFKSRVKGGVLSHVLSNQEREIEAATKARVLSEDHDLHEKEHEGFRAAAAAEILEGELHATEKEGEVKALDRAKRGPLADAEARRIQNEEAAAAIENEIRAREERTRATAQEQVAAGRVLQTEAAARQQADAEIIRQTIEARKREIEVKQKQIAREVLQGNLDEAAKLTAETNAIGDRVTSDQQLLDTQAAQAFAEGQGANILAGTLDVKAKTNLSRQTLQSEEYLREIEAELQALTTFKDAWEKVHRTQMEAQIRKGDLDTQQEERKTEEAHKLQIDPGTLRALEDETRKRRARIEQLKENINTKQALEQIKQSHARATDTQGKAMADLINQDKAAAEELQVQLSRAKEIALSKERDKILKDQGSIPVRETEVRTKHFLEDQKIYQNIGYDQMMIYEKELNVRAANLREAIVQKVRDRQSAKTERDLLKTTLDERAKVLSYVTSQGGEFSRYGTEKLREDIKGVPEEVYIDESNKEQRTKSVQTLQAQVLSAALHESVGADPKALQKALQKLKVRWGDDYKARMSTLVNNLDKTAGDGARNKAGLFKIHVENGVEDYKAVDVSEYNSEDARHWRTKRTEALAQHNATKLVTIADSVSRGKDGQILFESPEDLKVLEKTFNRLNPNTVGMVNLKVIDELNQGFKNIAEKYKMGTSAEATQIAQDKITTAINAMLKGVTNTQGIETLLNNIEFLRGKIKVVESNEIVASGGKNGQGRKGKKAEFK